MSCRHQLLDYQNPCRQRRRRKLTQTWLIISPISLMFSGHHKDKLPSNLAVLCGSNNYVWSITKCRNSHLFGHVQQLCQMSTLSIGNLSYKGILPGARKASKPYKYPDPEGPFQPRSDFWYSSKPEFITETHSRSEWSYVNLINKKWKTLTKFSTTLFECLVTKHHFS